MRNLFIPIALSLAASAAAAPPHVVEVGYQVARNDLTMAEVTDRLEQDGKTYRLTETLKGKGVFSLRGDATRSSQGAVVADGLRPVKYEDKRSGRETQAADFDPSAKTPTPLRQDLLSLLWGFAFFQPKGAVTYSVHNGKQATTYTYEVAGREKVKTPAGEFDALKIVKRREKPEDKVTEVWLAADRNFIPVRVLVIDKGGNRLDQVATRITTQ